MQCDWMGFIFSAHFRIGKLSLSAKGGHDVRSVIRERPPVDSTALETDAEPRPEISALRDISSPATTLDKRKHPLNIHTVSTP